MGSPTFDALFAVTKVEGTASFLVFTADGLGYIGTITVLLLKDFGGKGGGGGQGSSDEAVHDKGVFKVLALTFSTFVLTSMAPVALYFYYREYDSVGNLEEQEGEEEGLLLERGDGEAAEGKSYLDGGDDDDNDGEVGEQDAGANSDDDSDRDDNVSVVPRST